jgi:hypothetical protein
MDQYKTKVNVLCKKLTESTNVANIDIFKGSKRNFFFYGIDVKLKISLRGQQTN